MNVRTCIAAFLVAAAAATGSALAATEARDPVRLVLQRSDFPAGTKWSVDRLTSYDLAPLGFSGKAADLQATVPTSGQSCYESLSARCWYLEAKLFVADQSQARKLFALAKRADGLFSDVLEHRYIDQISLPRYGDEQLAFVETKPKWKANVLVRKNGVLWQLRIGSFTDRWRVPKAQVIAELRKYALKQKLRVGAG